MVTVGPSGKCQIDDRPAVKKEPRAITHSGLLGSLLPQLWLFYPGGGDLWGDGVPPGRAFEASTVQ